MPFMHCPVICHKLSISVSVYEKITESSFSKVNKANIFLITRIYSKTQLVL